jgi:hypothetical protein
MREYNFSNMMDVEQYCTKKTIAAAVTRKLKNGASLKECVEAATEVIRNNNKGEKWGSTESDILKHVKWMEKHNAKFKINGDTYKIVF